MRGKLWSRQYADLVMVLTGARILAESGVSWWPHKEPSSSAVIPGKRQNGVIRLLRQHRKDMTEIFVGKLQLCWYLLGLTCFHLRNSWRNCETYDFSQHVYLDSVFLFASVRKLRLLRTSVPPKRLTKSFFLFSKSPSLLSTFVLMERHTIYLQDAKLRLRYQGKKMRSPATGVRQAPKLLASRSAERVSRSLPLQS